MLLALAAQGIQIFLATHDFLLSQELSLAGEYKSDDSVPVRFFALSAVRTREFQSWLRTLSRIWKAIRSSRSLRHTTTGSNSSLQSRPLQKPWRQAVPTTIPEENIEFIFGDNWIVKKYDKGLTLTHRRHPATQSWRDALKACRLRDGDVRVVVWLEDDALFDTTRPNGKAAAAIFVTALKNRLRWFPGRVFVVNRDFNSGALPEVTARDLAGAAGHGGAAATKVGK
jgi:hypothetical protein